MSIFESSFSLFAQSLEGWSLSGSDPAGDLEELYSDYAALCGEAEGEFQNSVLTLAQKVLSRMTKELHAHCERQLAIVSTRMQVVRSEKVKTRVVEIPLSPCPVANAAESLKLEPVLNRPDPVLEAFLAQLPIKTIDSKGFERDPDFPTSKPQLG